ncbi:hypothetical protein Q7O60_01035 [Pseudomonas protegens]|uniref:hypothetical protein n=1 Tax=Pseudomonas TaxID=286 RepID=UPI00234D3AE2|nr:MULTISPECIES: hypothetical protein [Pseudomonas]MDC7813220.1 hypothetical protein [Pseudomonas sp. BLCC-B112]MDP9501565.1 hypothetical protein [Pseudomonas protegens]
MNTNPDHPYIVSMRKCMLEQRDELNDHESILVHLFELAVPDRAVNDPKLYWEQYIAWYKARLDASEKYWDYPAQATSEKYKGPSVEARV